MRPCAPLCGVVESRPMKAPNITRRDLLAALVGAVVAVAVLAPFRWRVYPVSGARALFLVNPWTGAARYYDEDAAFVVAPMRDK